jgi:GNAT superfamily N-acetyltransferase
MLEQEAQAVNVVLRTSTELLPDALTELFAAAWPDGTTPNFELTRSLCWVSAHVGERLVGFVNVVGDGGLHAFVIDPTVHPDLRRHGIGLGLVRCAADEARDLGAEWLHVDYAPELAQFYQRCGFRPTPAGLIDLLEAAPAVSAPAVALRKYSAADADACRAVIGGLSSWFGVPKAAEAYLADLPRLPTWVATLGNEASVVGFISVTAPQPRAFEVHVLAVARERHGQGVGRALLGIAERFSAAQGACLLQVKTLGPSHADAHYEKTRGFYAHLGYEALFETDKLWGEGNPTLILVKSLS